MVRTYLRKRFRDDWPLLVLGLGCIVLAFAFAQFGDLVMQGKFQSLDSAMREGTVPGRPSLVLAFFTGVSFLGRKESLVVLGLLIGWRLFPGTRWWMPLLAVCAFGCAELVDWLKSGYQVLRPPFGEETSASHSFPSGHASGTAAIAVFMTYIAVRQRVHPWLFASGAAVLTLFVGVSRIYLDKHWASDVVGGWVVGAAFGAGFAALYEWILRHQRLRAATISDPSTPGVTRT